MDEETDMAPVGQSDRDALRELAEAGNELAMDRLADLAEQRGDLAELSELLDEGNTRAGLFLTRRAVAERNLRRLQELSDAGSEDAEAALERLLRRS
jgi:hypothetical protein